jgi:spore coat polysaccharide biosynthesis protein SpsF
MINGKKVVATIEARMTSSRLPGKVMMPLAGKSVMYHMIERLRRSKYVDEVVAATTVNATDDPVAKLAEEMGAACFRGSEDDVMGRVVQAGKEHKAEILVQGMADSPLVDWRLVDRCIELLEKDQLDCAMNEAVETYPIGFDIRSYNFSTLAQAEKDDTGKMFREHAGYSIRSRPERFKVGNFEAKGEMRWPELRLTLDTKEDYALISAVFDELYPKNPDFSAEDVVRFLRTRPDLVAINAAIEQKVPEKEYGMN